MFGAQGTAVGAISPPRQRNFPSLPHPVEEQEGETEVRAALVAKAQYLADTGDAEAAAKAFEAAEAKTAGAGPKLDLVLCRARLDLGRDDWRALRATLDRAQALAEAGGDWERRNRLKLYEAVAAMGCRKFSTAADLLLDCLPTFSACVMLKAFFWVLGGP